MTPLNGPSANSALGVHYSRLICVNKDFRVYVIWHGGSPGRVVCVGHGDIATQLNDCLNDASVLAYQMMGPLFVTWASVSSSRREGVARYLTDMWHPLLGDGGVTSPRSRCIRRLLHSRRHAVENGVERLAQFHILIPGPGRLGAAGNLFVRPCTHVF